MALARKRVVWTCAAALSLACAGCDSGGGGTPSPVGGGATPSPSPSPTPTPSPSSTGVFGTLGQASAQTFSTYGFSFRATDGGFGYEPVAGTEDPTFTPTMRLGSASQLFLTLPGLGEGLLTPNGASGFSPQLGQTYLGFVALGGGGALQVILKPSGTSALTHSMVGSWVSAPDTTKPSDPYLAAIFVYGVPTAPTALPGAGVRSYSLTTQSSTAAPALTVDFSARTITGAIVLGPETAPVTLSLQGVTLTGNGTQFSGETVIPTSGVRGTFEGQFTGPTGEEMIGRFTYAGPTGLAVTTWSASRE